VASCYACQQGTDRAGVSMMTQRTKWEQRNYGRQADGMTLRNKPHC
jgi:hypothetical protein